MLDESYIDRVNNAMDPLRWECLGLNTSLTAVTDTRYPLSCLIEGRVTQQLLFAFSSQGLCPEEELRQIRAWLKCTLHYILTSCPNSDCIFVSLVKILQEWNVMWAIVGGQEQLPPSLTVRRLEAAILAVLSVQGLMGPGVETLRKLEQLAMRVTTYG